MMLIFLSACDLNVRDDNENWLVIQGFLLADAPVSLSIAPLIEGQSLTIEEATLSALSGEEIQLQYENGFLIGPEDDLIQANSIYNLRVVCEERTVSARIEVPAQLEINQVSAQTIPIDEASIGQPIFTILWENNEETTQLLVLEEEAGSPIPFTVPSGQFPISFNGPVPGQGATLFDTDFEFYGNHTLSIYAVPEVYETAFFYRPDPLDGALSAAPDNIYNGSGYVYGASKIEVDITISQ